MPVLADNPVTVVEKDLEMLQMLLNLKEVLPKQGELIKEYLPVKPLQEALTKLAEVRQIINVEIENQQKSFPQVVEQNVKLFVPDKLVLNEDSQEHLVKILVELYYSLQIYYPITVIPENRDSFTTQMDNLLMNGAIRVQEFLTILNDIWEPLRSQGIKTDKNEIFIQIGGVGVQIDLINKIDFPTLTGILKHTLYDAPIKILEAKLVAARSDAKKTRPWWLRGEQPTEEHTKALQRIDKLGEDLVINKSSCNDGLYAKALDSLRTRLEDLEDSLPSLRPAIFPRAHFFRADSWTAYNEQKTKIIELKIKIFRIEDKLRTNPNTKTAYTGTAHLLRCLPDDVIECVISNIKAKAKETAREAPQPAPKPVVLPERPVLVKSESDSDSDLEGAPENIATAAAEVPEESTATASSGEAPKVPPKPKRKNQEESTPT